MRKQLSEDENKGSVGTLSRGLDILELFAGGSPELTQTEISDRLGLPVPTVHRLVKLLTERGWLVRDPASRRLRLGLGAARLLPAVRLPRGRPATFRCDPLPFNRASLAWLWSGSKELGVGPIP